MSDSKIVNNQLNSKTKNGEGKCKRSDLNLLLLDFVNGKLSSEKEEEIIDHGLKCQQCQEDLDFRVFLQAKLIENREEIEKKIQTSL